MAVLDEVSKAELGPKPVDAESTHDVVFGEITEDGPNYRNVHKPR